VYADGSVAYENGDLTPVRALSSYCECGYRHWWNGREYDNPPDLVSGMLKPACCRWGEVKGKAIPLQA
jgi:deubiquitinating protein VCIP135